MASPEQGGAHLYQLTAHQIIDPERMKGWVGLVGSPYCGWFTHISGHPSATGRAWDTESSSVKDRRSTTVPRNQPHRLLSGYRQRHTWAAPSRWRTASSTSADGRRSQFWKCTAMKCQSCWRPGDRFLSNTVTRDSSNAMMADRHIERHCTWSSGALLSRDHTSLDWPWHHHHHHHHHNAFLVRLLQTWT